MNTPKILPWYAHKAGISIERAEALWKSAVARTVAQTKSTSTSERVGLTLDTFQQLLTQEQALSCTPRVTPFLRIQQQLWQLPLQAMEDLLSVSAFRQAA